MALVLDTNALSALAAGDRNLERLLTGEHEVAVPVAVLGEYLYGIRQSRYRRQYEEWLARNLADYTVLIIDVDTAHEYARIRSELKTSGKPMPSNDLWIAAAARRHDGALVTRDAHFGNVRGLKVRRW